MKKEKSFEERLVEKNDRVIAPNLFIGLGGQGCKMVASLAKKATENNNPAENTAFVALDTDVNELRKVKLTSNKVITVQTSSRMTIGEYLEYDDNARENWFPINDIILDKTPTEGAGQVRAISNLVAHNAIREGEFTAINDAIDSLFPLSQDDYQQSVHVTVISTLAGGTGSGLILPVALYVKNYLETIRQQKSAIIRGFFILPDVMESVITNNVELSNQYSNAYASIRELDALMRRPYDVELQERYPDLKVIIPKIGGNGYEEFNDAPFNFCFLFNKMTNRGSLIDDKDDLLNQAVECIYDMSISPISAGVNSQEDNIIREKISSQNKASFAGAGASKIIYPYEDVVEYVALNWAKGSVSSQWLEVDNYIIDAQKDRNQALNRGDFADPFDPDAAYMDYIKSNAESNPFYKALIRQTQYTDTESTDPKELSVKFCDDLCAYTERLRVTNLKQSTAQKYRQSCLQKKKLAVEPAEDISGEQYASEKGSRNSYTRGAIDQYIMCQDATIRNANMQVDQIASSIINANYEKNLGNDVPVLEKYMFVEGENFMHPNAARYFLLKIASELQVKIDEFKPFLEKNKKAVDENLQKIKILREQPDDYDESKWQKFINDHSKKLTFEPCGRILSVGNVIDNMLVKGSGTKRNAGTLDDYCYYLINIKVLEKIKQYIETISEGYKQFYVKMSGDVKKIKDDIRDLETRYTDVKGVPRIYVCASEKCLKKFNSACKNPIGLYDLPTEFTKSVFDKSKKYADMKRDGTLSEQYGIDDEDTSNNEAGLNVFFGDVFNDIIMKFWRKSVIDNYNSILDLDAVNAIYKEALVEASCIAPKEKNAYLEKKINDAKNLAVPFIDPPRGVQRREISAIAFHSSILDKEEGLNEENAKFFKERCIDSYRRSDSEDLNKHEILFYQSIYNIAAKNIAKMLPPKDVSATNSKDKKDKGGLYFATYHERIARIEPLDSENTEISPHIQRDWQYINVLPEVDPDYQKYVERRIAKAFVYALISGKIAYKKHDKNGYNYCYELVDAKLRSPELIVSNGTLCDQFYEVLDALSICPRYVDRLMEMYDEEIKFELNNGVDFNGTQFVINYATSFAIDEFSFEPMMNILFIPVLYKASAGANYIKAWGEAITDAVFEIIDDIIYKFESNRMIDDVTCEFLLQLFNEFDQNIDKLVAIADNVTESKRKHSRLKNMAGDSVTLNVLDRIVNKLADVDGKSSGEDQYAPVVDKIMSRRRELSNR